MKTYEEQLLDIIKEVSPAEYKSLVNGDKVAVEEHLEYLAEKYPTLEDARKAFEKMY